MRYFKYKNTKNTEMAAARAHYAELTAREKRLFLKEKILSKLVEILFFGISISLFVFFGVFISWILQHASFGPAILYVVSEVVLWGGALIISLVIGGVIVLPFWDKISTKHRTVKREILSKACDRLREYYGLQEPCLVTKCYDSSDPAFKDHDICLFMVGEELRLTANLKFGFFHGDKDLGCYAFAPEEISVTYIQKEQYMATKLKADGVEFVLGKRAIAYVRQNAIKMMNGNRG